MTNNYDPNQKRGGAANAGNWTQYENSGPEGALPDSTPPVETPISDEALAAVETVFAQDLAAIDAAKLRSEASALVLLNARALKAMPTAKYVVARYDFVNEHLDISEVIDAHGNDIYDEDHGMNACVEIFDTDDMPTRGNHGFEYDHDDDSFTFTLDRNPAPVERAVTTPYVTFGERRRAEFEAGKAGVAETVLGRFPDATEVVIYNAAEDEGEIHFGVLEIRAGNKVLWDTDTDEKLRPANSYSGSPFEEALADDAVYLDRFGMGELFQPGTAAGKPAWYGVTLPL